MAVFTLADFTAGLLAGWAQIAVGQPLDLVKTIVQMEHNHLSLAELLRRVRIQSNGFRISGFYKGASSMFLGNGITLSFEFGLNQAIKSCFRKYINRSDQQLIPIYQISLAGSTVGVLASLIYSPMEFCKIQKQMNNPLYAQYSGAAEIFFSKIKEGNIRTVYTGLLSCFGREAIGCFTYFTTYQKYIRWSLGESGHSHSHTKTSHILIAGSLAGLAFWTISYPLDTIKTHIQSGKFSKYSDSLRYLLKSKSLYRGISIVLLRSAPLNAATFLVFQRVKHSMHSLGF